MNKQLCTLFRKGVELFALGRECGRLCFRSGNLRQMGLPDREELRILKKEGGGEDLKIEINVDEKAEDLKVSITCRELTPEIEKILARLRMLNRQLTAYKDGEIYLLDISQVIYVEAVDRKCFLYTSSDVYQSDFKLYEMEQQLKECGFFRVNKSCLIALQAISSLKADVNRHIRITLNNGEQIIASRQYAEELKKRLGVR